MRFSSSLRTTILLLAIVCVAGIALMLLRVLPGRSAPAILFGVVIVVCSFVETVIVPIAAYRLVRHKADRLPVNIAATVAGAFAAAPFLALWYLVYR